MYHLTEAYVMTTLLVALASFIGALLFSAAIVAAGGKDTDTRSNRCILTTVLDALPQMRSAWRAGSDARRHVGSALFGFADHIYRPAFLAKQFYDDMLFSLDSI